MRASVTLKARRNVDGGARAARYRVKVDSRHFKAGEIISPGHVGQTMAIVRRGRTRREIPVHHLEKIDEMISFAQFLAETPFYTEVDKDYENKATERLDHVQDKQYPWKKIGKIGDHEVHKQSFPEHGASSYRVVHPNTRKVALHLDTENAHGGEQVTMISGIKKSPVKAHELYHHLVTKQGVKLHSDTSQSPGGVHIWKKLHEMPGVKIQHTSNINGRERPLHTGNDWGRNYGFDSYFTAKKA